MRTGSDTFWHGGVPGLRVGDRLLPPSVTGTDRNLHQYSKEFAPGVQDGAKVYVTTDRNAAKAFAALYPKGALYRVRPEGEMTVDPDAPDGTSFACESATVEAVYDRLVNLSPARAFRILSSSKPGRKRA